jgi:nicotinate-nucleotide adenylyltransferase
LKIAIFGSAFNPIHSGHLLIAQNALKTFSLDKILFTPCALPPHKPSADFVPNEHRLEMIRLAIRDEPKFELLTYELEKGGISYSIDTVKHVCSKFRDAEVFFLIGSDNFETIGTWYEFSKLIGLCEFLVIERPGRRLFEPPPSVSPQLLSQFKYRVFTGPTQEVSSSEIRTKLREGKNVSQLLPGPVYEYLRKTKLYLTALEKK